MRFKDPESERIFKDHAVTVVENTPKAQVLKCRRPGTSEYSFQVVCSDNMVAMNGDIGELLIIPGYGRSGLAWLRGSIKSRSYVLEKAAREMKLKEYDHKYARKEVQDLSAQALIDADGDYKDRHYKALIRVYIEMDDCPTEEKFYELWYDNDLDEPPNVMKNTHQVELQLDALTWMCNELDKINFEIQKAPEAVNGQ